MTTRCIPARAGAQALASLERDHSLKADDAEAEKHRQMRVLGLDLQRYRAVTIWSSGYQVNFTTAPLTDQYA